MARERPLLISLMLAVLLSLSSNAQEPTADSHIQANVPKGKSFQEYLKRDLTSYFCKAYKDCRVEFEFLRNRPTQTGIAYPKYYLWTKAFSGNKLISEGAVRVAAIDQKHFDVTNFLAADEIAASPAQVEQIFPAALVHKIIAKAGHQ